MTHGCDSGGRGPVGMRPRLGEPCGDRSLVTALLTVGLEGFSSLSVVAVHGQRVRSAHFGSRDDRLFELGSVTKTMTAMLLADAVARGEVRLDDELGSLLDLGVSPARRATLEQLASHRSGLPRVGGGLLEQLRMALAGLFGVNPYRASASDVVHQAKRVRLLRSGRFAYSNGSAARIGDN